MEHLNFYGNLEIFWTGVVGARKGWDLCDCCCYFPSQFTSKNQTVAKNWFHGYIGQRDCWMDEVDERHSSPEQVFVRQIVQPKMFRPTGDSFKLELNVPSRSEVDLRRGSQEELSVQELKAICQDKCTILQTVTLKWCVFFPSATNVAKIENAVPTSTIPDNTWYWNILVHHHII